MRLLRIPSWQLAVPISIGPFELLYGSHGPFFEGEQIVAVQIELTKALAAGGQHFIARNAPIASAVVKKEASLLSRKLAGLRCSWPRHLTRILAYFFRLGLSSPPVKTNCRHDKTKH